MFPEYRDLITKLKIEDMRFLRLFNEHNDLDQTIKNIESGLEYASSAEIESLKKLKLKSKDQIYALLRKISQK